MKKFKEIFKEVFFKNYVAYMIVSWTCLFILFNHIDTFWWTTLYCLFGAATIATLLVIRVALYKISDQETGASYSSPVNEIFEPKQLEKNPIHLYAGSPCAICDTDTPVSDTIEGCDWVLDKIIAERTDWEPKIIKPILRDISNMTNEEALEVANLVWFALGNKKIDSVEVKTTPIFPYAAIYFNWYQDIDVPADKFILSLDNDHHTIKLFQIKKLPVYEQLIPMPVYQSHKVTAYLIKKGFNLGILEEGSYVIRNYK